MEGGVHVCACGGLGVISQVLLFVLGFEILILVWSYQAGEAVFWDLNSGPHAFTVSTLQM